MSEPRWPLDATIEFLSEEVKYRDGVAIQCKIFSARPGYVELTDSMRTTICTLEAVRKMVKQRVALCLESAKEYLGIEGDEGWDSIRALLEALPDKEKP